MEGEGPGDPDLEVEGEGRATVDVERKGVGNSKFNDSISNTFMAQRLIILHITHIVLLYSFKVTETPDSKMAARRHLGF